MEYCDRRFRLYCQEARVNRVNRYRWIAEVTQAIDERDWNTLLAYAVVILALLLVLCALRLIFQETDEPRRRRSFSFRVRRGSLRRSRRNGS